MSDGKAVIVNEVGNIDPEKFIIKLFLEVNPRIKEINDRIDGGLNLKISNVRKNPNQNEKYKYNTLIDITGDGCHISDSDLSKVTFSYGRWDIARMAFKETGTIGVPDVPLQVISNTKEGIIDAFYGLIDNVVFVSDHPEYEGVKEWRGFVEDDNLTSIYTQWVERERIYSNEFVIFAKEYNPDSAFEDSDFVE